jgi:dolichol-phosphate mannosyltransferase
MNAGQAASAAARGPTLQDGPSHEGTVKLGHRKLVTISIPVYNEEGNVAALLGRLRGLAETHRTAYEFEFLFTDNASEDRTYEMLMEAARADPRIRVLRFSRNFGFQRSILTNYLNARGDAVVQIDADLQDPPELISQFLEMWEKGYLVVYGIRRRRVESRAMEWSRKLYYRVVDQLSEVSVPPDAGDFRLIDRRIVEHLRTLKDQNPYLRGVIAALGYPQTGVAYDRTARVAGESKFGFFKLAKLGLDGITSQSTKPLNYITVFGFGLCLLTLGMAGVYLLLWLFNINAAPAGFTTLVLIQLFATGINAAMLGILGEYIGRIFDNVRGHPFTIIERTVDGADERRLLEPETEKSKDKEKSQ